MKLEQTTKVLSSSAKRTLRAECREVVNSPETMLLSQRVLRMLVTTATSHVLRPYVGGRASKQCAQTNCPRPGGQRKCGGCSEAGAGHYAIKCIVYQISQKNKKLKFHVKASKTMVIVSIIKSLMMYYSMAMKIKV